VALFSCGFARDAVVEADTDVDSDKRELWTDEGEEGEDDGRGVADDDVDEVAGNTIWGLTGSTRDGDGRDVDVSKDGADDDKRGVEPELGATTLVTLDVEVKGRLVEVCAMAVGLLEEGEREVEVVVAQHLVVVEVTCEMLVGDGIAQGLTCSVERVNGTALGGGTILVDFTADGTTVETDVLGKEKDGKEDGNADVTAILSDSDDNASAGASLTHERTEHEVEVGVATEEDPEIGIHEEGEEDDGDDKEIFCALDPRETVASEWMRVVVVAAAAHCVKKADVGVKGIMARASGAGCVSPKVCRFAGRDDDTYAESGEDDADNDADNDDDDDEEDDVLGTDGSEDVDVLMG
jgi:hypothetical protein